MTFCILKVELRLGRGFLVILGRPYSQSAIGMTLAAVGSHTAICGSAVASDSQLTFCILDWMGDEIRGKGRGDESGMYEERGRWMCNTLAKPFHCWAFMIR